MTWIELCFWCCTAGMVYTYAMYPLIMFMWVRWRCRPVRREAFLDSVSIVICAHDEADRIASRRHEMNALLQHAGIQGELIIVSDGSTDGTATAARDGAAPNCRVIELRENVGKAAALNRACSAATGTVIVFADVRQRWHPDALGLLVENFADPEVGAATGELCLETSDGAVAGVGLYWRYEKWIRKLESRAHSMVGVTGAISAVRRELFCEIPARTVLDDVYWPMQVAMRGYRVVHDERARAYDRLPDRPGDEFSRKVRTLSGNFQLIARLPTALLPTCNPVWFQFVSHKLMRLAVPWLLLAMLPTAALLPGSIYRLTLAAQIAGYALALAGFCRPVHGRSRLASAATSFLVLNAAAWWAFWIWLGGRTGAAWKKVRYEARPLAQFDAETRSSTA